MPCLICCRPTASSTCSPRCKRLYLAAVSSGRCFYLWKQAGLARWHLEDQPVLRACVRAGLDLLAEVEGWRVV